MLVLLMGGNGPGSIMRLAARISSIACICVLFMIIVGEFIPAQQPGSGMNARELTMALLLFPGGVIIGMVTAWWNERLGGAITVAALVGFYVADYAISGSLPRGPWFAIFAFPGILFLLSWYLNKTK